jgi:Uma2 family endonuclease
MALIMTTSPRVPALCAGDHLTRDEFERRYAAMPALKKAELIEGVVYMGSPVNLVRHGQPHHVLSTWLGFYCTATPGLIAADNTTLRLDLDNEPQPDLLLCLPAAAGGRSKVAADGYLEGPPELVLEVAANSVSYDLHQKLDVYRRSGVQEYWCTASRTARSTGSGSIAAPMRACNRTRPASWRAACSPACGSACRRCSLATCRRCARCSNAASRHRSTRRSVAA